jgi:hypothetical protein
MDETRPKGSEFLAEIGRSEQIQASGHANIFARREPKRAINVAAGAAETFGPGEIKETMEQAETGSRGPVKR